MSDKPWERNWQQPSQETVKPWEKNWGANSEASKEAYPIASELNAPAQKTEEAPLSVSETLAKMKNGGFFNLRKQLAAGGAMGSVGALADTASYLTHDTNLSDLVTGQKPSTFAQRYADRGIDINSLPVAIGKMGGNLVTAAGVAGGLASGLAKVAKSADVVKAAAPWVDALRNSGVVGEGNLIPKFGRSVLTGGLTGGVTSAITNPEEIGKDTAIGAFAPTALAGLGSAASKGYDLYKGMIPKVRAGNIARQLLGETLEDTRLKLADSTEDLTAAQAAFGTAAPEFAAAGEFGAKTLGVPYLAKQLRQEAGRAGALDEATPNLERAVNTENQVAAARTADLTQGVATKEQALTNQLRNFGAGSAKDLPQLPLGAEIVGRREALKQEAKAPFKEAYNSLYEKYPEKFSLAPVYSTASDILSDLKTKLNPDLAKGVITKAENIFGPSASTLKTEVKQLPKGQIKRTTGAPATETSGNLSDMHDLLSEIKSSERALGNNDQFAQTAANLKTLRLGVEDAINKGLSKEALGEYKALSGEYKAKVADPFYTGTSLDIARNKIANRAPLIAPENITSKYLTESGANEFNRTFGKDPKAVEAMSSGIEQQMLNSPNPEKFISDNRFAISTLNNNNPTLIPKLENLANQLRGFKGTQGVIEAESKAIPKQVAEEAANASSAANQSRIIKGLRDTLVPYAGKENAAGFLTALNDPNLTKLNVAEQLGGLQSVESELLRNAALTRQASAGRGAFADAWKKNTFREKLPSYLDPKVATANKAIGIVENAVATATGKVISAGMESPEAALKMLAMYPADQRIAILKALRQSGPTVARAAVSSNNINKE